MVYNSIITKDSTSQGATLEQYFVGDIRYIDIPRTNSSDGFNDISEYAFANLPNLEEVFLPDNFVSIDAKAFYNCPNLKRIIVTSKPTKKLKQKAPW